MFANEKWQGIFLSMDYEKYLKARNCLEEEGISCKAKITDNRMRLAPQSLILLNKQGAYHEIFVKHKDMSRARGILSQQNLL